MHVVYGGTFDPVHNGHLRVAVELQEMLGVGQVHLMPSHIPPHRGHPGGSGRHRLELLELAVAGAPGLVVDDRELARGGASYTVDTLRQLRQQLGPDAPLAMVVGSDAFAGFDRWHDWASIPGLAHIVLVTRPGAGLAPGSVPARLLAERRATEASLLRSAAAGYILELAPPLLDISATGIRERLAAGRSIRYLVPDGVLSRIHALGLYGCKGDEPQG